MTDSVAERDFTIRFPDGSTETGPVVDLRDSAAATGPIASRIQRAIRHGCPSAPGRPTVHASAPGRVHAHIARLDCDADVRTRPALAAVAADRGVETPHDDDLVGAVRSLRSSPPAAVDDAELREARRRAAEAGAETERLRERVATVRGRVTALRDAPSADGEALTAAEASLSEATRQFSEVATERVAAAQRLAVLEKRVRSARDQRDARLRLEDRVGNLERAVRDARVAAVADDFRDARHALRDRIRDRGGIEPAEPSADVLDALAITRLAPIRAPVVVAADVVDAFGGPTATFESLDAPLVIG
ncbi:hypothetical protein [Halobellus litoreus]|uniref:Uncharacterized protein n=1 Tax=Halobellus litoreus TaxID=755310 RepID=A0ABD6DT38_9EURY|nr:hypothetical protein [Halobellus litoreus]